MKSAFKLNALHTLCLAAALTCTGAGVWAQAPMTSAAPAPAASESGASGGHGMMGRHDPAKMQAWMAKRQAALKEKLKITPAQEPEWTRFTAAMQPPAGGWGQRLTPEQRAEIDKLTTPERIDKMRAMRTQRMADRTAAMDSRGAATKVFYAALSPEQQKAFDAEHRSMAQHHGGDRYHGGMHHNKS